jgi:hypothetical protein
MGCYDERQRDRELKERGFVDVKDRRVLDEAFMSGEVSS